MAIPASSRSRTTWARTCAPPWAGTVSLRVCSSSVASPSRSRLMTSAALAMSSRLWTTTSTRAPPRSDLSSSAVPRAMILPWSTTAIESASSSASSRYCVVSSRVVPSRTRPRMTSHMPEPAARVEPGRRLVEEQQLRPADQRAAEVEPAAHAARVGLDDAVAGVGQLELLEQLVGPALGLGLRQLVQPPEHDQVLAAGQVLVDGRVLAGQADDRAELLGLLDDVEARPRSRGRHPA